MLFTNGDLIRCMFQTLLSYSATLSDDGARALRERVSKLLQTPSSFSQADSAELERILKESSDSVLASILTHQVNSQTSVVAFIATHLVKYFAMPPSSDSAYNGTLCLLITPPYTTN